LTHGRDFRDEDPENEITNNDLLIRFIDMREPPGCPGDLMSKVLSLVF